MSAKDLEFLKTQILNLEIKLQGERDRNYVMKLEKDGCLYKTIDCCHKPHPKIEYDIFSESFDYIPVLETSYEKFDKRSVAEGVMPRILTVDLEKISTFDVSVLAEKKIVAVKMVNLSNYVAKKYLADTILRSVKRENLVLFLDENSCTTKILDLIFLEVPPSKIVLPISKNLLNLDDTNSLKIKKCSILVSDSIDDEDLIDYLSVTPIRQVLISYPKNDEMLKQEPNVVAMPDNMQELVEWVAEVKDFEPEQIILATANNACKLLRRLKAICDQLVEKEAELEEYVSEDNTPVIAPTEEPKVATSEVKKTVPRQETIESSDDGYEESNDRQDLTMDMLRSKNSEEEAYKSYLEILLDRVSKTCSWNVSDEDSEAGELLDVKTIPKSRPKAKERLATKQAAKKSPDAPQKRTIINDCFLDTQGRWRDVKTGHDRPTPSGASSIVTPKPTDKKVASLTKSRSDSVGSKTTKISTTPKSSPKNGGYFRDSRGRLHGPDGKFCKDPEFVSLEASVTHQETPKTSKKVTSTSERTVYDGGYFLDKNGKWHDPNGKFCTPPESVQRMAGKVAVTTKNVEKSVVPSRPVLETPKSTTTTPERKTLPDGSFQDSRGHWHGPNGKFIPTPLTPTPVSTPRSTSTVSNSSSTRMTTIDGSYQDARGRWHGSNGRYIPKPTSPVYDSGYSSFSTPSYVGGWGSSSSSISSISSGLSGYSQDRNGRWHDNHGRFCRNPYE